MSGGWSSRPVALTDPAMTANDVTTHYVLNGQSVVREMRLVNDVLTPTATYLSGRGGSAVPRTQ